MECYSTLFLTITLYTHIVKEGNMDLVFTGILLFEDFWNCFGPVCVSGCLNSIQTSSDGPKSKLNCISVN